MKAVVFHGPRDLSLDEVADPRVEQPQDALIRITTANICGSVLHPYEGRSDKLAALDCMTAFGTTDFRDDPATVGVPTQILHGDSDETVAFVGSGKRTHEAISGSQLHLIAGAPHGCNVSDAEEWNDIVLGFLAR